MTSAAWKERFEFIASFEAGPEALCGVAVGFRLRQRALHVYSEKERVPLFKQICDGSAPAEEKTEQLARLMNDSQASCRCLSTSPPDPATPLLGSIEPAGAMLGRSGPLLTD